VSGTITHSQSQLQFLLHCALLIKPCPRCEISLQCRQPSRRL